MDVNKKCDYEVLDIFFLWVSEVEQVSQGKASLASYFTQPGMCLPSHCNKILKFIQKKCLVLRLVYNFLKKTRQKIYRTFIGLCVGNVFDILLEQFHLTLGLDFLLEYCVPLTRHNYITSKQYIVSLEKKMHYSSSPSNHFIFIIELLALSYMVHLYSLSTYAKYM